MREPVALWCLVPLRLFAGFAMLKAGLGKATAHWLSEPKLQGVLDGWLRDGKPYAFYAGFMRHTVLPHVHLFSWLIVGGEVLVGVALLVGLFSRLAALAGLFLVGNILLGAGDLPGANPTWTMVFIMLTLLLTAPGRVLGLDAAFRGKLPRWLV